jgi:hypothetical protein
MRAKVQVVGGSVFFLEVFVSCLFLISILGRIITLNIRKSILMRSICQVRTTIDSFKHISSFNRDFWVDPVCVVPGPDELPLVYSV